jgi:hypothetical protein
MKIWAILIVAAGLMGGCARTADTGQGGGGYYDTGGNAGAATNDTNRTTLDKATVPEP